MSFNFNPNSTSGSSGGFNFGSSGNLGTGSTGGFNFGGNASNTANTQNAGTTGGFNFGASNTSTSTQNAGTSGGFNFGASSTGNTAGTTTGGFNFGSSSGGGGNTAAGTTGFNFGSTGTTPSGTTTGGFNFGSSSGGGGNTAAGTTGFNFGSTGTTPSGTTTGGFNFGSSGNTGNTGSGFNFGSTGTTSGSTTGFNFGGTTGSGSTGFNLGTSGSNFGVQSSGFESSFPAQSIDRKLTRIRNSYNPDSQLCRFHHWLYNVTEPTRIEGQWKSLYQKYHNIIHESQWKEAQLRNPSPKNLIPVPARSFQDLTERVQAQNQRIEKFQVLLKNLDKQISALQRTHEVDIVSRTEKIKAKHNILYNRVIKLMSQLNVMSNRGLGLGSEDITIQTKLLSLQRELQKPNQYRGRLNELFPQLNYHVQHLGRNNQNFNDDVMDEQTVNQIKDFLVQQTKGLKSVVNVVQTDLEFINEMSKKFPSK